MTASGHIATAAGVLMITHNPIYVIGLCLILHLAADAIPHAEWRPFQKATILATVLMAADSFVIMVLVASMFLLLGASPWLVIFAIAASLLPDLTNTWAKKYFKAFRALHVFMHTWPLTPGEPPGEKIDWNRTVTGRTPTAIKILLQAVLIVTVEALMVLGA